MTKQAERQSLHRSLAAASTTIILVVTVLVGLACLSFAEDGPKPDPAGTATGDKTSAVDAAGNPLSILARQAERLVAFAG